MFLNRFFINQLIVVGIRRMYVLELGLVNFTLRKFYLVNHEKLNKMKI